MIENIDCIKSLIDECMCSSSSSVKYQAVSEAETKYQRLQDSSQRLQSCKRTRFCYAPERFAQAMDESPIEGKNVDV